MKALVSKVASGAAAVGLLIALTAVQRPNVIAQTSGGLWEISGMPGQPDPNRQCVGNTMTFAQIEHRGQSCTQAVISDSPTSAIVEYSCSNGGFGRTELTLLTPRSLRVKTQGISRGTPFNYVIQARRVGTCQAH